MASGEVLSAILHYKRNIERISDPPERALEHEDRLLHCINRLYKLPVNINHLQETGIGKTVNALRKIEGEKGLGDAAKALVAKWKTMVMLQDEEDRRQRELPASTSNEHEVKKIKLIRAVEKSHVKKTDDSRSHKRDHGNKDKQKHASKKSKTDYLHHGKERKRKLSDEKGGNDDENNRKHHSKLKKTTPISYAEDIAEQDTQVEKYSPKCIDSKCMKLKTKQSNETEEENQKKNDKYEAFVAKSDKKHELKTDSSSSSSKSKSYLKNYEVNNTNCEKSEDKKSKKAKTSDEEIGGGAEEEEEEGGGGIDSHSGASFAEALGPMVVKKTKKKFSTSASVTPSEVPSETVKKEKKQDRQIDVNRLAEPNLMSMLPVPTPHYKPSPIYHLPPQEASRRRIQAEEDALNTIMSNKNQRTKVYSGVKGGLPYVPTLYDFCCRVLQQHLDAIEYTGGIPYTLLKPILDGASPAQLFQFEHFNPYIIEDTDHLWKFHVNKEFRNESRQEFESWRDMYLRCIDEREEKYKAVTANIQKSIEQSAPVRKAKLAYIDIAKPPRNILRKQIKNGTSKPPASRLLGQDNPEAVKVAPPKQMASKEHVAVRVKPKIAPLMQKTLKSIKMTRFKR